MGVWLNGGDKKQVCAGHGIKAPGGRVPGWFLLLTVVIGRWREANELPHARCLNVELPGVQQKIHEKILSLELPFCLTVQGLSGVPHWYWLAVFFRHCAVQ